MARGVLCKVNTQEEVKILCQARIDAQCIIGRLWSLYGKIETDGTEMRVLAYAMTTVAALTDLIDEAAGLIDDEAATYDLRAAQPEEVAE